jgi:hypothetical protein
MTIDDVLAEELNDGRPVLAAVEGDPVRVMARHLGRRPCRARDLGGDARLVPRRDDGIYEQMHFVAGAGTITDADGGWSPRSGPVSWCSARHAGSSLWEVSETVGRPTRS